MAKGIELAGIGNDATLADREVTGDVFRAACVVLAGQALRAAGGDWDAAGAILGPVLEAVGAVSYEPALSRGPWGRQVQERPS